MNRQALLWVILSVTLLVIVILGAGLWLVGNQQRVPVTRAAEEPVTNYFELPPPGLPFPGPETPSPSPQGPTSGGIEKQDFSYGEPYEGQAGPTAEKQAAPAPTPRPTPAPTPKTHPTASREPAAPKTTPSAKRPSRQYWIQTGSYKSKSKADSCNAVLIENGLSGVITPKTFDGDTYFRVRIGPYPNKAEAEKFLAWIRKINGFEESYISLDFSAKR